MTRFASFRVAFAAAAAMALSACGINSVPAAEENAKAKWADVEAQFQRRANLIPNLVEVAQGAAENERTILTEVTDARARATSVNIDAADLGDAEKMAEFQAAQSQLGQGLGRLLASFEAYPQIQSNQNFLALQSQLEGTENRIAVAIRDYNEAVREYNTTIRTFPDTIGANIIHGAEPLVPYEAATEGAEVAPTIDMTSN
ncbi:MULTISPECIES: LemA family protein [Qipengyuania]|uniref:LemA protein n=1 Tax=Qipengyuania nanhaisediminis TaxID=604088 RepID=A0A1I5NTP5_9SPHN|nr:MULTISPECIES: LemA family protein [Qipengyuania]MCA0902693.1 LemA family protein [Qipengyuania aquimaris]SFP24686.1 LemA protein [Qipengyuania nanhaisediminis]